MKSEHKKILTGIGVVLFYLIASFAQILPFSILHIDYTTIPVWIKVIYLLIYQLLELIVIMTIFKKQLKENWLDLKKNHKKYWKEYFKYWFLLLGLMVISNLAITLLTPNDIASNEEAIRETFEIAPLYTFISAVFIAPVLEELVFRQGIRNIFENKIIFILCSGLLFGSMHVITSFTSYYELLYIIPYSIPGLIFAYLLTKTNNIFIPISLHFIHNGVLMSLQVLLYLLS